MNTDDRFDKTFDKFCALFEKLISKNVDHHWFQWLQWVIVTSALYAIWRKTGSISIIIVTAFSTLLLIFRAWVTAQDIFKSYIISLKGKPKINYILIIFLFTLVSACPVIVMSLLGEFFFWDTEVKMYNKKTTHLAKKLASRLFLVVGYTPN